MFLKMRKKKNQTHLFLIMATMLAKHIIFPLSLFLFVLHEFPVVNAMLVKDMHAFCKETNDVNFCLKYIGTDKRILAARDLNDVLLIAVTLAN